MASILQSLTIPVPPNKPRLRGVSHQIGAIVAFLATVLVMVQVAGSSKKQLAMLVFGGSLTLLLGTSATYHRINWRPGPRNVLRRLDHAAIFVLIAGGWTPLLLLVPSTDLPHTTPPLFGGYAPLLGIWAFGLLGVIQSMLWPRAPRWLTAALCVIMGWGVSFAAWQRISIVGASNLILVIVAGIAYSLGAVVYATKKPDPAPATFGYHEVFHLLVVIASVFLFAYVLAVMAAVP